MPLLPMTLLASSVELVRGTVMPTSGPSKGAPEAAGLGMGPAGVPMVVIDGAGVAALADAVTNGDSALVHAAHAAMANAVATAPSGRLASMAPA